MTSRARAEPYSINDRVIGIDLEDLRAIPRVVAVARGLPKAQSILGALRGKFLSVLATDDLTARAVLELEGWRADNRFGPDTRASNVIEPRTRSGAWQDIKVVRIPSATKALVR